MSKFRAHETFFIRKGWLYKGLKYIVSEPLLFSGQVGNPMDILGLGSNMVKSLRYWLQAVGLTMEPTSGKRHQSLTESFGNIVWQFDPYIEEMGTLWLLNYKLATNEKLATAWFYFFNIFRMNEFSKEEFVSGLEHYVHYVLDENVSKNSLEDDFNCIINTYVSRLKLHPEKVHPESNIDCPLAELGIIDIVSKKERLYKKSEPQKEALHPLIVLAVILDRAGDRKEIKIGDLKDEINNIGKVFNLDMILLTYYLNKISSLGYIKVKRTAGLDVINVQTTMSFKECVELYYNEING